MNSLTLIRVMVGRTPNIPDNDLSNDLPDEQGIGDPRTYRQSVLLGVLPPEQDVDHGPANITD